MKVRFLDHREAFLQIIIGIIPKATAASPKDFVFSVCEKQQSEKSTSNDYSNLIKFINFSFTSQAYKFQVTLIK